MKKLWTRLTPFTSDTSGALGTLFDLNALGMVHDPYGCLSNYMSHDEFRRGAQAPYYVSIAQNQMDMILGNEVPLYRGFRQLIQASTPSVVAMIGTPVTALLSSDLERYAKDMEKEFGIPAIAIHTTGERLYDSGASHAYLQLCRRFVRPRTATNPKHVNLLGLTSLDFGSLAAHQALEKQIAELGWRVQARLGMGATLPELETAADAQVSLVVSASGLAAARYLQEQYGVPYVADLPVGPVGAARVEAALAQAALGSDGAILVAEPEGLSETLIIGEQISANGLRLYVEEQLGVKAEVATFFHFEAGLARPGDTALDGEDALETLLQSGRFKRIIGDPLLARFLDKTSVVEHISWPHMAVSGQLYAGEIPVLSGAKAKNLLPQSSNA